MNTAYSSAYPTSNLNSVSRKDGGGQQRLIPELDCMQCSQVGSERRPRFVQYNSILTVDGKSKRGVGDLHSREHMATVNTLVFHKCPPHV